MVERIAGSDSYTRLQYLRRNHQQELSRGEKRNALLSCCVIVELVDVDLESTFVATKAAEQDRAHFVHVLRGQSPKHAVGSIGS